MHQKQYNYGYIPTGGTGTTGGSGTMGGSGGSVQLVVLVQLVAQVHVESLEIYGLLAIGNN